MESREVGERFLPASGPSIGIARQILGAARARLWPRAGLQAAPARGSRDYVGGLWQEMGDLQFRFMVEQGLRPEHVFLDVACGRLRGGVRFIPYLEAGNYLGIDIEQPLIDRGIEEELGRTMFEIKRPEFVVSGAFEFDRFSKRPDFALAQSLFTHLIETDIGLCLSNLGKHAKPTTRFFATFFEVEEPVANPPVSHPHEPFRYTRSQIAELGQRSGWQMRYIGAWRHPRKQMMVEYHQNAPHG